MKTTLLVILLALLCSEINMAQVNSSRIMKSHTVKLNFSLKGHTAVMVPVFAFGPGSENFSGIFLFHNENLLAQGIKFMYDISPSEGMAKPQEKNFGILESALPDIANRIENRG